MAMSFDRGTARQKRDYAYGQVCSVDGTVLPGYLLSAVNQEHGIVGIRPGSSAPLPALPIGTRLRVLPNHACATAAQHDQYHLLDGENHVAGTWPRFRGWD